MKKTITYALLSTALQLTILLAFYNLNEEFNKAPHSVHTWRQCDGASFGLHYYTYGNSLFHPQFYNIEFSNGEAVSEFPIIYWLAAKLSGTSHFQAEWIRYLSFLFVAIYLLIANAAIFDIIKSYALSFYTAFLPFLSVVFCFYSNNFLPDVPATCAILTALSMYYFYVKNSNGLWLMLSLFFFTLAGLLKITVLVPYFILLLAAFIELFLGKKIFHSALVKSYKHAVMLLLPLLLAAAWIVFLKTYNTHYDSHYFLTKTFPYWELDDYHKSEFWEAFTVRWSDAYFSRVTGKIALIVIVFSMVIAFVKKRIVGWLLLVFLLLQITITTLFAGQYYIHDYYAIALVSLPIIAYITLFYFLSRKLIWRILLPLIFIPYLISDIFYTKEKLQLRFETKWEDEWSEKLAKCTPELEKIGLLKNDKILVLGDPSSCISLYTLQRKGWTQMNFYFFKGIDDIDFMKRHGLAWVVFFPDTRNKFSVWDNMKFKKTILINGFEFAQL